jgi:hypothetical protein
MPWFVRLGNQLGTLFIVEVQSLDELHRILASDKRIVGGVEPVFGAAGDEPEAGTLRNRWK